MSTISQWDGSLVFSHKYTFKINKNVKDEFTNHTEHFDSNFARFELLFAIIAAKISFANELRQLNQPRPKF